MIFQTVEKGKEGKETSEKKLAVAKPCIFAQQSASHAENAAKKGWRTPFSFKITPRRARRTGPQALFVGSFCAKLKRPLYRGRGRTDETRHSARVSEQPLFPFPARNACGCERGAQPRPVFLCGGCVHAVVVRHHKPGQHVHGRHLCGH